MPVSARSATVLCSIHALTLQTAPPQTEDNLDLQKLVRRFSGYEACLRGLELKLNSPEEAQSLGDREPAVE